MLLASALAPTWAVAEASDPDRTASTTDLASLSLEQLLDIEVTSVSKKAQKLSGAAAAIYVITQEEIRRSGMTTIPELLRMVPGMDVAEVTSNVWAVGSRGFNGVFTNKLLVLIDGRSIYAQTFGGVNWDVQNLPLEDIDRIEVIRGSGGTLWGANAVNGVINIITKSAEDTQGGLLKVSAGNIQQPNVSFRYGGKLGDATYLRLYGQGFRSGRFPDATGALVNDRWGGGQVGFRIDSTPSNADALMVEGALYAENSNYIIHQGSLTPPFNFSVDNTDRNRGGHILARWTRRLSATSEMTLQGYYDRADRTRTATWDERADTYDLDFQHRFALTASQEVVWGLGYRSVDISYNNEPPITYDPPRQRIDLFSAFIQDEISLRDNLHLSLGSKFEHNAFTGFEYQPNARLIWQPRPDRSLWASVSRAVRMPTRFEREIKLILEVVPVPGPGPGPLPAELTVTGNPAFRSEDVLAFEVGYRQEISARFTVDATAYYNRYGNLTTWDPTAPFLEVTPPPPHLVIPLQVNNLMRGEAYGVEVAAKWQVTANWRLSSSYTWFQARMRLDPTSNDLNTLLQIEGNSPEHQFQVRSQLDLPHDLKLDGALYYVDALQNPTIPSYVRADLRLAWRPRAGLELSVVGQNLLDGRHPEFGGALMLPSQTPRSVYGQAAWRF